MPQWTLDEGFVAWLRTTMSPEQVSMLDLNGVLDDIYGGYLAGIAAERARLAPVIASVQVMNDKLGADAHEDYYMDLLLAVGAVIVAARNAGLLTEEK